MTIKPKKCKAKGCGVVFSPARPMQCVCSPACAQLLARAKKEQAETKQRQEQRKADKAKREILKPISKLEEECRKIVQEIARIRDKDDGCISCHMGPNYQGIWHGSHYRAHGGCSSLQFHLWNIHKSCEQCNFFKGGNKEGFIRGLMEKPGYGPERLEWLDNQPKSQKFSREYLIRFKQVMGKRRNRLKRIANR
jgi:hypothetical protein